VLLEAADWAGTLFELDDMVMAMFELVGIKGLDAIEALLEPLPDNIVDELIATLLVEVAIDPVPLAILAELAGACT